MAVTRTFETARLLGKYPAEEDDAGIAQAMGESQRELKPWLEWAQDMPGLDEVRKQTRESQAACRAGERFFFNLFLKETGDFVCRLELRPAPKSIQDMIVPGDWWEFGYWCRTKYAGQGYMSEGLNGAMRWAMSQMGLAWFIIRMDGENSRSQSLAARLGFKMIQERATTFLGRSTVERVYEKRVLP